MKQSFRKYILFLAISLIGGVNILAQNIDSLTYSMTQDVNITQQMGWVAPTEIKIYVDRNGNKVKLGDSLFVGSPSSSATISVGGTASSSNNNTPAVMSKTSGQYVYMKTGEFIRNTEAGLINGEEGSVLIVNGIYAKHTRNSKNSPVDIAIVAKNVKARKFVGNDRRIISNLEKALEVGEILLKNRKMTKSEALAMLKEKKELFDLGVLSKEEFDKIKATLSPILLEK